jgi:hypothetical protein
VKHIVVVACVALATTVGCGYWRAPPAGDTAPAGWGDAPAADHPTSAVVRSASQRAVAVPPGSRGLEERLGNLETLLRDGVIGQAEYRERRREVLRDAFD